MGKSRIEGDIREILQKHFEEDEKRLDILTHTVTRIDTRLGHLEEKMEKFGINLDVVTRWMYKIIGGLTLLGVGLSYGIVQVI